MLTINETDSPDDGQNYDLVLASGSPRRSDILIMLFKYSCIKQESHIFYNIFLIILIYLVFEILKITGLPLLSYGYYFSALNTFALFKMTLLPPYKPHSFSNI